MRARPAWVDDTDPTPERHLRSLSVAPPGSTRQLLDLVGLLESIPFDPDCSPWDVTLIEGLEDGRAALYLRAHHVLTDGVGGIRLLGLLLDEPAWPRADVTSARQRRSGPQPSRAATATGIRARSRSPSISRRRCAGSSVGVNAARDLRPDRAAGAWRPTGPRRRQLGLPSADGHRRTAVVAAGVALAVQPLRGDLRRGGTTTRRSPSAAAATTSWSPPRPPASGATTSELGQPSPELRLATPTSQRRDHEAGGNWFAPARLEVPTSVGRPGPQFGVVVERLAQARREPALQVASTLAATLGRLPTRLLLPALHAQADSVDFAATALPGLRGPRHVCGSLIEAIYPLGPRLGCPMNITAFGNDDRLDVGIALDPAALEQPDLLVECLTETPSTATSRRLPARVPAPAKVG